MQQNVHVVKPTVCSCWTNILAEGRGRSHSMALVPPSGDNYNTQCCPCPFVCLCSLFQATNYKVDLLIWNKEVRWGFITVKLRKGHNVTVASIEQ